MNLGRVINKLKVNFLFIQIFIAISSCGDSRNSRNTVEQSTLEQSTVERIDRLYKALFRNGESLYKYSTENKKDFNDKLIALAKKENTVTNTPDESISPKELEGIAKYIEFLSKFFFYNYNKEGLEKGSEPKDISSTVIPRPVPSLQEYKERFKNSYEKIKEGSGNNDIAKNEDVLKLIQMLEAFEF